MEARLHREFTRFLAALQYFTCVPVPSWVDHSRSTLNGAVRYLPAVGLLVGIVGAGVYCLAGVALPTQAALVLSMAATVAFTGGFHEDGLADATDGLGGGDTRDHVLAIMKDPRLGAFGAIALILALLLKYQSLLGLPATRVTGALVAGHGISRLAAVGIMATLSYVRDDESSRAKPFATQVSALSMAVAALTGLSPLLLLGKAGALGFVLVVAVALIWRRYIARRLGGYTGDCLGAAQQITELAFYLGLLAALR